MREERKPSFLESLMVSAGVGAVTGAVSGAVDLPEKGREIFTGTMVNAALTMLDDYKKKDRKGYIPGL